MGFLRKCFKSVSGNGGWVLEGILEGKTESALESKTNKKFSRTKGMYELFHTN